MSSQSSHWKCCPPDSDAENDAGGAGENDAGGAGENDADCMNYASTKEQYEKREKSDEVTTTVKDHPTVMFRDRTFGKDDKKRYSAERASITSNNSDFQGRSRSGSTASTASSISVASSAAANRTSWNIDTVQEEPNEWNEPLVRRHFKQVPANNDSSKKRKSATKDTLLDDLDDLDQEEQMAEVYPTLASRKPVSKNLTTVRKESVRSDSSKKRLSATQDNLLDTHSSDDSTYTDINPKQKDDSEKEHSKIFEGTDSNSTEEANCMEITIKTEEETTNSKTIVGKERDADEKVITADSSTSSYCMTCPSTIISDVSKACRVTQCSPPYDCSSYGCLVVPSSKAYDHTDFDDDLASY